MSMMSYWSICVSIITSRIIIFTYIGPVTTVLLRCINSVENSSKYALTFTVHNIYGDEMYVFHLYIILSIKIEQMFYIVRES